MIAKVNLLPWREEGRKRYRQRFGFMLGGAAAMVVVLVGSVGWLLDWQQDIQSARNAQIRQEVTLLEEKLALLPKMDTQREALLKRLSVISDIQKGRNHITQLLSLLPGLVPQGVYLDDISLTGSHVKLSGKGESNGHLATLLANAEESAWIEGITMHSIVRAEEDKALINFKASFVMNPAQQDHRHEGEVQ
ncbi:PilN domain-containing protein [Photobacterium lutimaris]|uniref:Pilus assembly protein PilS n=1 Tax=Photobacterium lutimaris TaxID=388278 RepID=A0A2T3IX20_9GAMM|nr:PilN domain-containing protein [Photobacterium lutimaris]PSU33031.1 pilus assembly protein PilS [Photobacterium lutimaris]TDR73982.1 type IV pilus assembly protein PilN [Photobacterium lutimaris]